MNAGGFPETTRENKETDDLVDMFHITRATNLENDHGDDRRLVLAVEFDVAAAVDVCFATSSIRSSQE